MEQFGEDRDKGTMHRHRKVMNSWCRHTFVHSLCFSSVSSRDSDTGETIRKQPRLWKILGNSATWWETWCFHVKTIVSAFHEGYTKALNDNDLFLFKL